MGYGNYTVPNCYGGSCTSLCGNPSGPFVQCSVRERLRDFYADGVQGGSPACKSQRTDVEAQTGLRAPFATYAINYWGDNDEYRQRPYGGVVEATSGTACPTLRPDTDYQAQGHYMSNNMGCSSSYEQPLWVAPVPGIPEAKTLSSVAFPGLGNVCTRAL